MGWICVAEVCVCGGIVGQYGWVLECGLANGYVHVCVAVEEVLLLATTST